MNFKIFCVLVIAIIFFLFIGYKSVTKKVVKNKRVNMIKQNCSLASKSIHVYIHTCQYGNTFSDVISLGRRIMDYYHKSFCPLRVYVTVLLEQDHPDYYIHLNKELKRIDAENTMYKNMSRIEIIPSNINFNQTHGQLYAIRQIYTRSNFNQLGEKDYVLILNEQSVLYENWDKRVIEEYNSVGSESGSAHSITYMPTKTKYKIQQSSAPPSTLSGDFLKFVKSNTIDSSDSSVPEYTPTFTILERDDMYNISFAGRQPVGRISSPIQIIGASLDFLFLKRIFMRNFVSKIPNKYSVTQPDIVASMFLYNMNFRFFMPSKGLSYIKSTMVNRVSDKFHEKDEELTHRLIKSRIKKYQKFIGIRYPKTLSGKACMGIVNPSDAGEIVAKYGSMGEFERVKSYLCKD